MRTVEVLFVIIILLSAFLITTYFAVLPSPSQAFGTNLRELSLSTLETLDAQGILSATVFEDPHDPAWADLQKALSASLPPNVVYNLSVYDLSETGGVVTYHLNHSISDASFGVDSGATSLLVASPDVTYTQDPQKIACAGQSITLYILNCEHANGWWITGFTGQSLATEFHNLLSPYFETTVLVNSTSELNTLLNGNLLTSNPEERVNNAVIINTFGESVPIPSPLVDVYSGDYSQYCYFLGQKVNAYNWTWASIVGYPFYYVSNTLRFTGPFDHAWGIHGMKTVGPPGLDAFLEGLTGKVSGGTEIMRPLLNDVYLSPDATKLCNYYGVYPSPDQTASRALKDDILVGDYGLVATELFNRPLYPDQNYIPAATYENIVGGVGHGALTTIGLARIPDVRVTALGILMYYQPNVYKSLFEASDTSRLVTLQLGQQGGT